MLIMTDLSASPPLSESSSTPSQPVTQNPNLSALIQLADEGEKERKTTSRLVRLYKELNSSSDDDEWSDIPKTQVANSKVSRRWNTQFNRLKKIDPLYTEEDMWYQMGCSTTEAVRLMKTVRDTEPGKPRNEDVYNFHQKYSAYIHNFINHPTLRPARRPENYNGPIQSNTVPDQLELIIPASKDIRSGSSSPKAPHQGPHSPSPPPPPTTSNSISLLTPSSALNNINRTGQQAKPSIAGKSVFNVFIGDKDNLSQFIGSFSNARDIHSIEKYTQGSVVYVWHVDKKIVYQIVRHPSEPIKRQQFDVSPEWINIAKNAMANTGLSPASVPHDISSSTNLINPITVAPPGGINITDQYTSIKPLTPQIQRKRKQSHPSRIIVPWNAVFTNQSIDDNFTFVGCVDDDGKGYIGSIEILEKFKLSDGCVWNPGSKELWVVTSTKSNFIRVVSPEMEKKLIEAMKSSDISNPHQSLSPKFVSSATKSTSSTIRRRNPMQCELEQEEELKKAHDELMKKYEEFKNQISSYRKTHLFHQMGVSVKENPAVRKLLGGQEMGKKVWAFYKTHKETIQKFLNDTSISPVKFQLRGIGKTQVIINDTNQEESGDEDEENVYMDDYSEQNMDVDEINEMKAIAERVSQKYQELRQIEESYSKTDMWCQLQAITTPSDKRRQYQVGRQFMLGHTSKSERIFYQANKTKILKFIKESKFKPVHEWGRYKTLLKEADEQSDEEKEDAKQITPTKISTKKAQRSVAEEEPQSHPTKRSRLSDPNNFSDKKKTDEEIQPHPAKRPRITTDNEDKSAANKLVYQRGEIPSIPRTGDSVQGKVRKVEQRKESIRKECEKAKVTLQGIDDEISKLQAQREIELKRYEELQREDASITSKWEQFVELLNELPI